MNENVKRAKLDQRRAPIHEALEKFRNMRVVPFDVPGHKRGRGNPVKSNDCITYVQHGVADIGVVGKAPMSNDRKLQAGPRLPRTVLPKIRR